MPAPILHQGAVVQCAHGGQAMPTSPSPSVLLSGMPATTIAAPYTVAGCTFAPPAGNGPCATGQWVVGSVRVTTQGQPLVLLTSTGVCTPTGTPLMPVSAQTRVLAT